MSNLTGSIVIKSLADISCNSLTGLLNNEKFTTSFAYKDLGGVLDLVFNFDLDKLTLDRFPTVGSSTETDAAAQSSTSLASSGPETLFNVRGQPVGGGNYGAFLYHPGRELKRQPDQSQRYDEKRFRLRVF